MAAGQSDLDKMVSDQPEDIVRKKVLREDTGAADKEAEEISRSGGNAKLPRSYTPFRLTGGK